MNTTELKRLFDLPIFSSYLDLSELSHISKSTIKSIADYSWPFYKRYKLVKKNGSYREIYQPNYEVKAVQAWILRNILDKIRPSSYATAYRKNYSIKNNANYHRKNRYFVCLDLHDFFPSISIKKVYYVFNNIGYEPKASKLLARLCTVNGILPQGGITSPAISNLVCNKLDRRISGLASKKKIVYTRYADDITLSSNTRNKLNNIISVVGDIVTSEGFEINKDKTHHMGPAIQCKVTGLIKDASRPKFSIGKKRKNYIRSVIFNLIVCKRIIDTKYCNINSINGLLSFYKMIDSDSYLYLKRYLLRLQDSQGKM